MQYRLPIEDSAKMPRRTRICACLLILLLLSSCTSADNRRATETSVANGVASPSQTLTPSGDLLRIDDDLVTSIFVPTVEDPAYYAFTENWLYFRDSGDWIQTRTRSDDRTILVDPARPERLYRGNHPVCTMENPEPIKFSKSEDGGETWRTIPEGENIQPIAVDRELQDVVYGSDCGLAISNDAGETWEPYYRHPDYTVVTAVPLGERLLVLERSVSGRGRLRELNITVPEEPEIAGTLLEVRGVYALDANADRIIIGSDAGVMTSTDGGRNWATSRIGLEAVTSEEGDEPPLADPTEASEGVRGVLSVRIDPTNEARLFAGTRRGLYVSQDNGATWDRYQPERLDSPVETIAIGNGGGDLYVTTSNGVQIVPNP